MMSNLIGIFRKVKGESVRVVMQTEHPRLSCREPCQCHLAFSQILFHSQGTFKFIGSIRWVLMYEIRCYETCEFRDPEVVTDWCSRSELEPWRGQAEESRKTQSEIIQAIVRRRVQRHASALRSSDHKDPNTKSTPQVKAVSEDFICLKDRLALQAQKRRAAGPVAWPRCAEAGRSGQCEAARLRSLGPGRLRSHCGLTTDWIRMRIF